MRNAVGGNPGHFAKDDRENNGRNKRLNNKPKRAQNGLLINGGKVALDHEPKQVLVLPEFAPVDAPPGSAGADDGLIGILHDLQAHT